MEYVANAMVIGGYPSLSSAAGDNHEHFKMDADNWTYYCYRLNYRYNIVLVLNYLSDGSHMH